MLISQITVSPIKLRPFGGWGQAGGVVEAEVENEVEEVWI